ncbi:MAG TPA: glycosyltransferase family 87 protein [Candidatus Dormibacteraeota bacterium]
MDRRPRFELRALDNPAFRRVLLALVGIPIGLFYLWRVVLEPLVFGTYLGDFQESYMRAAGRIAGGFDPYDLCATLGCQEPTGPQYVTPPLLAWLLQPLVGIDSHVVAAAVVVVLNVSLALFLACMVRALHVRDWQLAALLVITALSFGPVIGNIDEGQVNLVLLALSGLWLWSWVEGGWWGGVPLAAAVALKVIQAPVGVLVLWGRRWAMLTAAIITGTGLCLLAAPQYLFEYLVKVLPVVSAGTGLYENHSPGGTIARLIDPATFLGAERGSPPLARTITILIAVIALVITLAVLRNPARDRTGRSLEAAAIVAVAPLVASYSWGTHLVLLLLPMLVLVAWGVRNRDWTVLAMVGGSSLLIGPGSQRLQTLLVSGYSNLLVLRVMAELGVVAVMAIWLASLLAVTRQRARAAGQTGLAEGLGQAENQPVASRLRGGNR